MSLDDLKVFFEAEHMRAEDLEKGAQLTKELELQEKLNNLKIAREEARK